MLLLNSLLTNARLIRFDIMGNTKVAPVGELVLSRKEEIVKQATIMFRNCGYAATSVRDLARESGIEAPSLYSHFKSKEEILKQICFEMARNFIKGLDKAQKIDHPEERLHRAIKAHITTITKNINASAVMWNEWKHLNSPHIDDFMRMKRNYEIRFQEIILKGMNKEDFKASDVIIVSNLLFSSMNGLSFWYHPEKFNSKKLTSIIYKLLLFGIRNKN